MSIVFEDEVEAYGEDFRKPAISDRLVLCAAAFGLGIHRCAGSNLARLEMIVAFQEWLRAFPNYSLDPTKKTTWANGQVRGPRVLPVLTGR